jgi:uncharacterized protein with ParB-like and HNH nuclease domain
MQTGSYEVHKLLKLIKENKFRIPHFQRDFRWSSAQIKLLIDSMTRNYPIGSLLMMAKSPEFNFQSRTIAAEISSDIEISSNFSLKSEDDFTDDNILYVLDGQQRLTSIARVFLNSDRNKAFYFDLHEIAKDFLKNDDDSTSWIKVLRKHGIEKDTDRRENNRLVRADIVMLDDVKTGVYISEYIEDSGEFPEWGNDKTRQRQEIAKVNRVFEKLRKYTIPIVFLEQDIGIESICRVFETINSTGMRLTTFDLAVAKFYPKKLDLRAKWEDAQSAHPILANFQVDGERVLQILVLRLSEESGQPLEVNRKTLLVGLKDEYIEKNWDEAIRALVRAYEWAKSMGACPH